MASTRTHAWVRPLPNALSGLRLAVAFALPFLPPPAWLPAILLGGLTDALDGWIARRFRASTWVGGILDGVADKAFLLATVVTLVRAERLEPLTAVLVLLRDVVVLGMAARFCLRRDWELLPLVPARALGKLTTVGLFVLFALLAAFPAPPPVLDHLALLVALFSGTAALDYLLRMQRLLRASAAAPAPKAAGVARG